MINDPVKEGTLYKTTLLILTHQSGCLLNKALDGCMYTVWLSVIVL